MLTVCPSHIKSALSRPAARPPHTSYAGATSLMRDRNSTTCADFDTMCNPRLRVSLLRAGLVGPHVAAGVLLNKKGSTR